MDRDSESQPSIFRVESEAAGGGAGAVPRSCVIVGSGMLAVQCAEHLREAGHELRAVLACDTTLADWTAREGVPQLDSVEMLAARLDQERVDWLFSVVNLLVLPMAVLGRASEAINCHDGPLPRYAGVNATSWALLAGETEHAVTWHRMTGAVGAGAIMVQRPVVVAAEDTALTLNLKCHQAAGEGFAELLEGLEAGTLAPRAQELARRELFRPASSSGGRGLPAVGSSGGGAVGADAGTRVRAGPRQPARGGEDPVVRPGGAGGAAGSAVDTVRRDTGDTAGDRADHWRVATGSVDVAVGELSGLVGEPVRAGDRRGSWDSRRAMGCRCCRSGKRGSYGRRMRRRQSARRPGSPGWSGTARFRCRSRDPRRARRGGGPPRGEKRRDWRG